MVLMVGTLSYTGFDSFIFFASRVLFMPTRSSGFLILFCFVLLCWSCWFFDRTAADFLGAEAYAFMQCNQQCFEYKVN